jgi:hypothetical protein
MDLPDIYRTFHPTTSEYTFSSINKTFSKIDHALGHKTSLRSFKKIEIIACIFSGHDRITIEINKQNFINCANTWKLNNIPKQPVGQ